MTAAQPQHGSHATLGAFLRCPVCQHVLLPDTFELLSDPHSRGHSYYVQCPRCRHSLQGTFLLGKEGMSFVGMLTDMLKDDILRFRSAPPITSDDVLALYETWHS